jgi:hypothetical protein
VKPKMLAAHWKNEEAPLIEGLNSLVCSSGKIYSLHQDQSLNLEKEQVCEWVSVGVLAECNLYGGEFVVKCGEAFAHGSIGFVALESRANREPIWLFSSVETNPFDQIEVKGSDVLVLSTSGAVLRFLPPLKNIVLLLPGIGPNIAFNPDGFAAG